MPRPRSERSAGVRRGLPSSCWLWPGRRWHGVALLGVLALQRLAGLSRTSCHFQARIGYAPVRPGRQGFGDDPQFGRRAPRQELREPTARIPFANSALAA
ncbi:hypothetical protein ACU4GD_46080 [Cupriavidus basilensis]